MAFSVGLLVCRNLPVFFWCLLPREMLPWGLAHLLVQGELQPSLQFCINHPAWWGGLPGLCPLTWRCGPLPSVPGDLGLLDKFKPGPFLGSSGPWAEVLG